MLANEKGTRGQGKGKGAWPEAGKGKGAQKGAAKGGGKGAFKGTCFACGKMGHRASECRTRQANAVEEEETEENEDEAHIHGVWSIGLCMR